MSSAVRFGLVGYGAWGSCHARAIREEAALVAVCAATEASRERARAELGSDVAICADHVELVQRADVEVVDIVVPNALHRPVAVAALRAGKHVLLEKPMATSAEDCDAIAAAARQSGKLLAIGHEARLSPLWGKVKQLIADGAIGTPRMAAIHLWRFPYRQGSGGWRYDPGRVGNWTLEEPIHYFDLLRWFMAPLGEPQSVVASANSARVPEQSGLRDNLTAIVQFHGGFATLSQTLAAYAYHLRGELVGTAGAIRTWWEGELDRTEHPRFAFEYFDGTRRHDIALSSTPGELFELQTEIRQVAACVRSGAPPPVGPADGTWAVRLCLAAEESARRGSPVRLAAPVTPEQQLAGG
jgi:myo-inositol 2-dehydrogenase/D-chiro-inositol 1-dehydrogenase